jgi:hypothetical protein
MAPAPLRSTPPPGLGRPALLLLVASSLAVASGCFDESTTEFCAVGMRRECLCPGGDESIQVCNDSGWQACECGCEPWATRACICGDGEDGLQICSETAAWGECQCTAASWPDTWEGPCGAGETECPGVGCVATAHSEANCGACGVVCQGCDRCIRGECTATCCPDQTNCGSTRAPFCVHLPSDVDNCGACGLACADSERCVGGVCVL